MSRTPDRPLKLMRHRQRGARDIADALATIVGVLERRSGRTGVQAKSSVLEAAMSKHNRRDPRLPDIKPVSSKEPLEQVMERARKKMGIKTVWERYGDRSVSGVEQGNPEREGEG